MSVLEDRFLKHVKKGDGCWEWTGSKFVSGYGRININGKTYRAHRLSAQLYLDNYTEELLVCHTCDNRICVRPDHLFMGTAFDNMQDMSRKGRSPYQQITHCPHGHEYTKENTWYQNGWRYCRECKLLRMRKYQRRNNV